MEKVTLAALGGYFAEHCAANGHRIMFKNGEWLASDAAAVVALAAAYSPAQAARQKAREVVLSEAKRRAMEALADPDTTATADQLRTVARNKCLAIRTQILSMTADQLERADFTQDSWWS